MMETRPPFKEQPGNAVAGARDSTRPTAKFLGTDNPRHLRAIRELLRSPVPRETLDRRAGCANSPELVAELRRRGLRVPCERIKFRDRDGKLCRPGVYHFSPSDRRKVYEWFASIGREVAL